jgi:ribose transport system ATP-binding protein
VTDAPALRIRGLHKAYGSTVALDGADLEVPAGAVHAVIGENGAGKSTLVKVLSGLVKPDGGVVELDGEPVELDSPGRSRQAGIAAAFQELSLAPDLTVADNLCLPDKPRGRFGTVSGRATRVRARTALERWEAGHIDVRVPAASLSLSAKQQVEIVGALARQPRLLILDEPTSALGRSEVEWLFRQVARLRETGATVIFVSHRLAEVRELCDSVTVLRNGRRAGSSPDMSLADEEIIRLMIGESLARIFPERPPSHGSDVVLAAHDLASGPLRRADLELHRGEILGVAGLQDHGQRQLFRALFGAERIEAGAVELDGVPVHLRSPRDAIRAGIGISLVPEDRATEGALLTMQGRANLTLPILDRFTTLGWVNRERERRAVREVLEKLDISERALVEPVEAFSGGNQQKIVIGKWLLADAHVLLLYDPTRGVDIKTKTEIYRLITDFAAEGRSVLFYSTDLEELVNLCHRVHVCYRGETGLPFEGERLDTERLLAAMLGGALPLEAAA